MISPRAFLLRFALAAVVTFGAVWAYVVAAPMAYLDRDYPLWIAKRTLMKECRPDTVAVFGDSRAVAGVLPATMAMPVENLALSGSSPVETYYMVRRVLRCATPPRLIVIAHSAAKYVSDPDFWQFSARMGFLDAAEIDAVEADARRLGATDLATAPRPSGLAYPLLARLYALRFPPLYFDSLVNGYVATRWAYNKAALHRAIAASGHAFFGTDPGSDLVADDATVTDWRVSPLVGFYMDRTLALAAARKVPVMIVSMPINQATCARMDPSVATGFAGYVGALAATHADIVSVNAAVPCWPDKYFGDAWHFNRAGAALYSRHLGQAIAAALGGSPPAPLATSGAAPGTAEVVTATADDTRKSESPPGFEPPHYGAEPVSARPLSSRPAAVRNEHVDGY